VADSLPTRDVRLLQTFDLLADLCHILESEALSALGVSQNPLRLRLTLRRGLFHGSLTSEGAAQHMGRPEGHEVGGQDDQETLEATDVTDQRK